MSEEVIFDDPVWEYVLVTKLQPYIPAVREWWAHYDEINVRSTGVFPIQLKENTPPPGLQVRMTITPVRSPIKHVQVFPFVMASYLQITGVPGGVNKMITRVCSKGLEIEEFAIVEKHNLPSTYQAGQWLGFIPKSILNGTEQLGKYIYFTLPELCQLAIGNVPGSVKYKCKNYIS